MVTLSRNEPEYVRYEIKIQPAPDVIPFPSRFKVRVKKHRLAGLLLKELVHYRGQKEVVTSRPCVYGVFSGPVGGFAPREDKCVGCLRCTTQYPEMVEIFRNPDRENLGDSHFTREYVDSVHYESQSGRVPVRGAGYRGKFGGEGWDGMWTDMSEIVRPTRDGIHGREFISTAVDIGEKPLLLQFNSEGIMVGETPHCLTIPIPMLFDAPPPSARTRALTEILVRSATETETFCILPLPEILEFSIRNRHVVPLISLSDCDRLSELGFAPSMIEMEKWDENLYGIIRDQFPEAIVAVRLPYSPGFEDRLLWLVDHGVGVFHLVGSYHGRGQNGEFVRDLISAGHRALVAVGKRDRTTLIGSGGIIAAEHVPKAIICGLDAVALDTPVLVALQARMIGECVDWNNNQFDIREVPVDWGVQRLKNLLASWRDQLLEILGAMGLREVRRSRGETGRAMFQEDLEIEAFGEIEGYGD
ncbi:MAG: glutamate synthase-related protein [bacterium]